LQWFRREAADLKNTDVHGQTRTYTDRRETGVWRYWERLAPAWRGSEGNEELQIKNYELRIRNGWTGLGRGFVGEIGEMISEFRFEISEEKLGDGLRCLNGV
jgi:hypothetical protein